MDLSPSLLKFPEPSVEKAVDGALAGLGLFAAFAAMGAIEKAFGVSLVAAPMMASAIIFFAAAAPPDPKGFLFGTLGCATICAFVHSLVGSFGSPAAAMGAAAGALCMIYKSTGCIFPPVAVLCILMAGKASPYSFVLKTWVPGHILMYTVAVLTSAVRGYARQQLK